MYDILIPVAEKDFTKLRFVYDAIIEHISGFDKVYCISSVKIPEALKLPFVEHYTDADIIVLDAAGVEQTVDTVVFAAGQYTASGSAFVTGTIATDGVVDKDGILIEVSEVPFVVT